MTKRKPSEIGLTDLLLQRLGGDADDRKAIESAIEEAGTLLLDGRYISFGAVATISATKSNRRRVVNNTHGRSIALDLPPRLRLRIQPCEAFRPRLLLPEEPVEEAEPQAQEERPRPRLSLKKMKQKALEEAQKPAFPPNEDASEVQRNGCDSMSQSADQNDHDPNEEGESGDGLDAAVPT